MRNPDAIPAAASAAAASAPAAMFSVRLLTFPDLNALTNAGIDDAWRTKQI